MRIIFEVPDLSVTRRAAARQIAALEKAGVIRQIAFDPWAETATIHELKNLGFPAAKLTEVRLTSKQKHLLLPLPPGGLQ